MLRESHRQLLNQLIGFAAVGGVGVVVDTAIFTGLDSTVLSPERLSSGPIIAKVVSTLVAIMINWIGNRYVTFRGHRSTNLVREAGQFLLVSVAGSLIGLACLLISHYVLGLTTTIDDAVSANGVGLVLGSIFRFVLTRLWVFRGAIAADDAAPVIEPIQAESSPSSAGSAA